MLQSALLSYIKQKKYLDTDGFKFNRYATCVATNLIQRKPPTLALHVDDVKASHKEKKFVYNFEQLIGFMYVDSNIEEVK